MDKKSEGSSNSRKLVVDGPGDVGRDLGFRV